MNGRPAAVAALPRDRTPCAFVKHSFAGAQTRLSRVKKPSAAIENCLARLATRSQRLKTRTAGASKPSADLSESSADVRKPSADVTKPSADARKPSARAKTPSRRDLACHARRDNCCRAGTHPRNSCDRAIREAKVPVRVSDCLSRCLTIACTFWPLTFARHNFRIPAPLKEHPCHHNSLNGTTGWTAKR